MKSLLSFRFVRELFIRLYPFDSEIKSSLLYEKFLFAVRFIGGNVRICNYLTFNWASSLVIGNDVTIKGGGRIDATAGLMIGDRTTISKNVNIGTTVKSEEIISYNPIVIGPGNVITNHIAPGTILPSVVDIENLIDLRTPIVFIVSTGRSGSKAISDFLNKQSSIDCYHDAFPHLNTWSCDLLYGRSSLSEIEEKLRALFCAFSARGISHFGLSDQKVAPFIPLLDKIFPNCRFVWLLRHPKSFVASSYPRGWFFNSEFGYSPNPNEYFPKEVVPSKFYADHRINGALCGEYSEDDWREMTAFERNCWYWKFWNDMIFRHLKDLSHKVIKIQLDQLNNRKEELCSFLEVTITDRSVGISNQAKYNKIERSQWTEEMVQHYNKHCAEGIKRWIDA